MKKLPLLFCILLVSAFALWKVFNKKSKYLMPDEDVEDEEEDEVYNEFVPGITGPRGEKVFIGAGGGRYYTKDLTDMYAGTHN